MINCNCGVQLSKNSYSRHLNSKRHLDYIKNQTPSSNNQKPEETKDEETESETDSNDAKSERNTEYDRNANESKVDLDDDTETEEIEVKQTSKKGQSKEYMNIIREKAILKLREKKQKKIDEEQMIKQKAVQYDLLIKSMKEKEEQEKKQKEMDKIKEMEYKSNQYDKLVRAQQRQAAVSTLSNQKIISDVKEQRINYLMRYLQNPSLY